MINVYAANATDFSANGLYILDPHCMSATISEKLNGEYVLRLELVINEHTVKLANEMVIKAPAPVRYTPVVMVNGTPQSTEIRRVETTTGERLNLRTKPSLTKGKIIRAYAVGTEVAITELSSDGKWYGVVTPDGNTGYMWAADLYYVRTETSASPAVPVGEEKKERDQLFRISTIVASFDTIEIEAQHISYDLRRNYVRKASTAGKTGAAAFSAVLEAAENEHEFIALSNVTATIEEDITRKSPIAAVLSDGGLVEQAGGEFLRDNYNLYWMDKIGRDRGVSIAYRKNLAGMSVNIDTNDLVTRIIPVGYNKNNEPIYGDPVDSPYIANYAQPYIVEYDYKDVKVGNEGFDNDAAVKAQVERLARLEYDSGMDKPTVEASVDYVDLQKTEIGERFAAFNGIFLGDLVRLKHEDYSYDFEVEVVAYEWDVLLGEYMGIELGSKKMTLADMRISPSQIGDGTLPGRKIQAGSISGAELGDVTISSQGASITITSPDDDDDKIIASIDKDGLHADTVTAGQINSDSIVNTAASQTVVLSTAADVQVFIAELSGKWLTGDIFIDATGANAGTFELRGVYGFGTITINGGAFSTVTVRDCGVSVRFVGSVFTTGATALTIINSCVQLNGAAIQGEIGILADRGADVLVYSCTGNCTTLLNVLGDASVRFDGSNMPYGTLGTVQGEVYSPYAFEEYFVPPEAPTVATVEMPAKLTRTWGGSWLSTDTFGNALYQGTTGGGTLRRGCMWFDLAAIRGKSIISATLSLKRYSGIGSGSAVAVSIYGTTATNASGTPSIGQHYADVSMANGATVTVDVTDAVQALANGTIGGLMIYDTRTGTYSGKTYTLGYVKLYGTDTANAPVLSVTYST